MPNYRELVEIGLYPKEEWTHGSGHGKGTTTLG